MMKLRLALVLLSSSIFLFNSIKAQHNGDSVIWVYGSKHSALEADLIGGTPMFPIYKFYQILQHEADHHHFPVVLREQSNLSNLLPFAYGTIERTAQISGTPTIDIKNTTGNFTIQEIDPDVIQLVFDTTVIADHLSVFITPSNANVLGATAVSQASILTVGHIVQFQLSGPGGTSPTNASSYTLNVLAYRPY